MSSVPVIPASLTASRLWRNQSFSTALPWMDSAAQESEALPPQLAVRRGTNPCHIEHMAKGWKIVAVLPSESGGAPLQEWLLVAIPDKGQAIKVVKSLHPHAAIRVESEADPERNRFA
jgi:hypothetical protein